MHFGLPVIRTCSGTGCSLKRDCIRWLWRGRDANAGKLPVAPWRLVHILDKSGSPIASRQVCDQLITRDQVES